MKLAPNEIAWYGKAAGFLFTSPAVGVDSEVVLFTAVCLAESGGDTEAMARTNLETLPDGSRNPSLGQRALGFGQISNFWQHQLLLKHGGNWRDPLTMANIVREIYLANGSRFSPWNAYTSGAYQKYLPDARIAADHPWPVVLYPAPTNLAPLSTAVVNLSSAVSALSNKMISDDTGLADLLHIVQTELANIQDTLDGVRAHFA